MNPYIEKNKLQILFFILCCMVISTISYADISSQKDGLLAPKQMKEEVRFYYKKLLETHPNPYQILTPEKLDNKIREVVNSINKPLNRREFSLIITTLNAYFDGHTQIYQAKEVYKFAEEGLKLPEYIISIKNGAFFFSENHSFVDISLQNKRIYKINGISSEALIALTQKYISIEFINTNYSLFLL